MQESHESLIGTIIRRLNSSINLDRDEFVRLICQRHIHVDHPDRIHKLAVIGDGAVVTGDVTIGPNTILFYHTAIQGDTAPIVIGEGCCIVDGVVMHNRIEVEDFVHIAHNCLIHRRKTAGTLRIGAGTLVGFGAQVHADIGRGCQIAPGVIVDREIPDYHFVHCKRLADGSRRTVVAAMKKANYQRVTEMYRSFWSRRIILNGQLVPLQWRPTDSDNGPNTLDRAIHNLKRHFNPDPTVWAAEQ